MRTKLQLISSTGSAIFSRLALLGSATLVTESMEFMEPIEFMEIMEFMEGVCPYIDISVYNR